MATSKLSLKLLIDKKGQRVLFAEAGKEFVDFLFSLLTLPIGTILSLVDNKVDMASSLPMLYQSVFNLDDEYVKSGQKKDVLLKHTASFPFIAPQVPLLPMIKEWSSSKDTKPSAAPTGQAATFYTCVSSYCNPKLFSATYGSRCKCDQRMVQSCNPSASATGGANRYKCRSCSTRSMFSNTYAGSYCLLCRRQSMTTLVPDYFSNSQQVDTQGGFVKALVTYLVADDLAVSPLSTSTINNISLLNKFNINDLGALEEKVVQIGMDEGLQLLKHSLNSKTVLTDVFLRGAATSRKRSKGIEVVKLEDDDTED